MRAIQNTCLLSAAVGLLIVGCFSHRESEADRAAATSGHTHRSAPHEAPAQPSSRTSGAEVRKRRERRVKVEEAPRDRVRASRRAARAKSRGLDVHPMTETREDDLSTFAVDVDTGSYTIARRELQSGRLPAPASVRVEEFINYFGYDYPEPDSGPFSVDLEAAPSPFGGESDRRLLRVGVQGKHVSGAERKPVHLTFLVDVSGSMKSREKLGLAKESLRVLTKNLREGDTVALATYAGRTANVLEPTGLGQRGRILSAISDLRAGGSTAMNSGLQIAYRLALRNYEPDHVNRVIVLSDGNANVGPNSHQEILERIEDYVDEGVTLSTIGFGSGSIHDTMMEQLANNGNGNYYFIDGRREARRVFGEEINGTLQVIAKDVKVQVDFDEEVVDRYRLIGYENRDVADRDFRNERVDAGEIGAGHTVTALYELEVAPEARGRLATVRVRHEKPKGSRVHEQAFGIETDRIRARLSGASADFKFAAAVAAFAEKLRGSPYGEDLSYGGIEELAQGAARGRPDRKEFVRLIRRARSDR